MSDTIIMYENGKAVGGEGHPTDADEITFDNTGTDIVANKAGLAIKEVNAKIQVFKFTKTYDVNIASGSIYRSNLIDCDCGIDLTNKKIFVSAVGFAGWTSLTSISGTKVQVNTYRGSSGTNLTGDIYIMICN